MLGAPESLVVGGTAGYMQWHSRIYGGGLFDYSVKPGPDLSRLRLGLVGLVTRSTKARFGQVGDQVNQAKGQGWSRPGPGA